MGIEIQSHSGLVVTARRQRGTGFRRECRCWPPAAGNETCPALRWSETRTDRKLRHRPASCSAGTVPPRGAAESPQRTAGETRRPCPPTEPPMSTAELPAPDATAVTRKVCHCIGVSGEQIEQVIDAGLAQTVRCVMNHTGAGTGCTACHPAIRRYLASRQQSQAENPVGMPAAALSASSLPGCCK